MESKINYIKISHYISTYKNRKFVCHEGCGCCFVGEFEIDLFELEDAMNQIDAITEYINQPKSDSFDWNYWINDIKPMLIKSSELLHRSLDKHAEYK